MTKPHVPTTAILALALAACNGEGDQVSYDVQAEDQGGGELIARPADAEGVEVDLPDTPMTPVPPEEDGDAPTD
jgi:hypothetical protein